MSEAKPTSEQLARRDHLADVLEEYDAPSWMIDNAAAGVFDPFSSKKANKHGYNLVNQARQNRLPVEFIRRVQAGEFDAPE
jgi:hypothetical protein